MSTTPERPAIDPVLAQLDQLNISPAQREEARMLYSRAGKFAAVVDDLARGVRSLAGAALGRLRRRMLDVARRRALSAPAAWER